MGAQGIHESGEANSSAHYRGSGRIQWAGVRASGGEADPATAGDGRHRETGIVVGTLTGAGSGYGRDDGRGCNTTDRADHGVERDIEVGRTGGRENANGIDLWAGRVRQGGGNDAPGRNGRGGGVGSRAGISAARGDVVLIGRPKVGQGNPAIGIGTTVGASRWGKGRYGGRAAAASAKDAKVIVARSGTRVNDRHYD